VSCLSFMLGKIYIIDIVTDYPYRLTQNYPRGNKNEQFELKA